MDCVDANGEVVIGYAATLHWNRLKLNYAGVLNYSDLNGISQSSSWRTHVFPKLESDQLRWSPDLLHMHGTWKSLDEPIYQTLIENEHGLVQWDCFQPRALADIHLCDKNLHRAYGYTERLQLTIKPWELKMNALRWGRFLSEEDALIWIALTGDHPVNLLFYNHHLVDDAVITNHSINSSKLNLRLEIKDSVPLRKGTLQKNLFGNARDILDFFPERILRVQESKWRAHGVLNKQNGSKTHGWIIHEVVLWKPNSKQS